MRRGRIILSLVLTVLLASISACQPVEPEQIEGIIQEIDTVNGVVTIITDDGETISLSIDTEATVETEGESSTVEKLEVGVSIQVEVDEDNQVVQRIKARQAEVEGVIIGFDGNEITIESEDGQKTSVFVTDSTRIESEDDLPASLTTLDIGKEVEIKFDPESQVAFAIDDKEEMIEEEGEEAGDEEDNEGNTVEVTLSSDDVKEEDEAIADEQPVSSDVEDIPGDSSETQDEPDDGDVEPDGAVEPFEELKPDVEPSVDGEVVQGGNVDIEGDAVPGGDVDIDGDGKITIVDVVGGLEALRARLAEAIAENRISGYYDAEWIRNAEAERERLAQEIERALSDDTYIVVIDGKALIMDIDPIGDLPDPVIDDPPDDGDHDDGDHDDGDHDDGDDHPDDGGHDDGGDDGGHSD